MEERTTRSPPPPSSEGAKRRMSATGQRDTAPEIAVRKLLHRRGLRYLVDARPLTNLRRRADIVFSSIRLAVFIDGCFWHGCPEHGTWPRANEDFWRAKIKGNRRRDRETDRLLREAGWTVVRAWEHEDPAKVAGRVQRMVRRLNRGDADKRT